MSLLCPWKSFCKMTVARREVKRILSPLAMNAHDIAERTTANMEIYMVAKKYMEATGLPLHVCAETFVQTHGRMQRGLSLLEAVNFYLDFHPATEVKKTLVEMIAEYANERRAMGVSLFNRSYVKKIERQVERLVAVLPGPDSIDFGHARSRSVASKPRVSHQHQEHYLPFSSDY